jgi:hypothetical protein
MTPRNSKTPCGTQNGFAHARKTLAVAVAMGRAKVLGEMLHEEIGRHLASRLPELSDVDCREFRVNGATRLASLLVAYFAALAAVVDGWVCGGLADARVDKLLDSPHRETLAGFRNAMLHPRSLVDDRLKHMHKSRKELLRWADELARTLEVAFKDWYVAVASRCGAEDWISEYRPTCSSVVERSNSQPGMLREGRRAHRSRHLSPTSRMGRY